MNYLNLIPSETMRKHMKKVGFAMTDRQAATVIYHELGCEESLAALEKLADETPDEKLSEQIRARIRYEKTAYERLTANDGRFIFMVQLEEDDNYTNVGIFRHFREAEAYALKKYPTDRIEIEKYHLIDGEIPKMTTIIRSNPNLIDEKNEEFTIIEDEYDGCYIGRISYYNGKAEHLWSNEMTKEEIAAVDEFDTDRFEDQFIPWPNPFDAGDLVRMVGDEEDIIGIVNTSAEYYEDFLQKVENGQYVDYMDASLRVEFLFEDGVFCHDHPSPINLERVDLTSIEPEQKRELLKYASYLVKGEGALDYVMDLYESYRRSAGR